MCILRKTCKCSFMAFFSLPSTRLHMWMHERSTIKPYVQVFLEMNTWMFETCRRHYNNKINTLMEKVRILLFLITKVHGVRWRKTIIFNSSPCTENHASRTCEHSDQQPQGNHEDSFRIFFLLEIRVIEIGYALWVYEGCPESIQPFWISREPVAWPWCNLAAS